MRHDVLMVRVDDPSLTLSEGLARYFAANERLLTTRDVSEDAAHFFRCHDVAHVVFGCDTTLFGEGTVKLWTIFGTTLGFWRHLRGYSDADAISLFRQYSRRHLAKNISGLILSAPGTIRRARRMDHRWPWSGYEPYLEWTLSDIRSEFGIKVSAAS